MLASRSCRNAALLLAIALEASTTAARAVFIASMADSSAAKASHAFCTAIAWVSAKQKDGISAVQGQHLRGRQRAGW